MNNEFFWNLALQKAHEAFERGEVPVGAVLVRHGSILAATHNRCKADKNPTHHAEYLALQEGLRISGENHLRDCDLFVTLEPCRMCVGALELVGIRRVYFGASSPKTGALIHHTQPAFEAYGGFYEKECSLFLKDFFQTRR